MFEALFGTEMPLALRFFVAFVVVLALIAIAAYLVRRFGASALTAAGTRSRQPRLAVIDAASVDGRRRLLLIRRDNVEHLVMIGGPTDVVIEPNIVRAIPATPAAREAPPARVTGPVTDMLPRAVPLAEGGTWPLAPEPAARPQRAAAPAPVAAQEDDVWTPPPEPAPREAAPREPATRESAPREAAAREPAPREAAPREPAPRESAPRVQNADRLAGLAADLSRTFHEPEAAPPPRRSEPRRVAAVQPQVSENEEQNLAEMAHRLETALHRPRQGGDITAIAAPARTIERAERIEPVASPRAEAKPKGSARPAFDSLEQEMASLLGRPAGKT